MQTKSRVMILGGIDEGKTTLTDALLNRRRRDKKLKTQALVYDDWIVDTPGEYTENPLYYRNLIVTSLEITHVMFVKDATREESIFAPGFSSGLNKLVIGVVTKIDDERANINDAIHLLKKAMVKGPIVSVSAFTGEGLHLLQDLVQLHSYAEMKRYVQENGSPLLTYHE